jgi:hypothetical protein
MPDLKAGGGYRIETSCTVHKASNFSKTICLAGINLRCLEMLCQLPSSRRLGRPGICNQGTARTNHLEQRKTLTINRNVFPSV